MRDPSPGYQEETFPSYFSRDRISLLFAACLFVCGSFSLLSVRETRNFVRQINQKFCHTIFVKNLSFD